DVCGLQVAVEEALLVRGFQRLRDLLRDGEGLIGGDWALSRFGQRGSPRGRVQGRAPSPPHSPPARRWPRCWDGSARRELGPPVEISRGGRGRRRTARGGF